MTTGRRLRRAPATIAAAIRAGVQIGRLLRHQISDVRDFAEELRAAVARRDETFLASAERVIFAYPNSPYRPLLEAGGYDFQRLTHLVRTRGLDGALDQLRADGVFVTIQEFKGLVPAVRGKTTLRFQPRDFATPDTTRAFQATSSGSRGAPTPSTVPLEELVARARLRRWLNLHYGLAGRDVLVWLSASTGLVWLLVGALTGERPVRWCSQVFEAAPHTRLLLTTVRAVSGRPLPPMEVVPADRATELARYISRVNTARGMVVETFASSALRLVLAADDAGLALGDVVFIVAGEPLTPAKRRAIEARGFRVLSRFSFTELGNCAWQCPVGHEADDLHVLTDRVAVREHLRPISPHGAQVRALLFTTLLPHARNVLLNVESGDEARLEERSCGCFLDRAGLRLHMHTIRSFEKLTAEGLTYLGPAVAELLEEELPRRFGGDGRHYQLVEGEDESGFTRLFLLVSPAVGPVDEDAVRRTVLREMARRHLVPAYGRIVQRAWEAAGTLQVLRREPLPTPSGKILHLHRGVLEQADARSAPRPPSAP
ncbi:MAG: hypothetical protein QN157_01985 [Armatimonadota bacterium]|nr:hypothetical protein [Armatimonadota bacterium]